jgi:PAS domain S-box-containing protein
MSRVLPDGAAATVSAELATGEPESRVLFELAGVGTAEADPATGRFLRVNRKQCQITGYTVEELLRRTVWDITHPDDRERDRVLFGQLLRGEVAEAPVEKRYLRKDGTTVWVHAVATVLRDEQGRPLRALAVIQDISERKTAEETLRASEERYRDLFENANDVIYTLDLEGRITSLNRRAEQVLGYTRAEGVGRAVADIIPAEHHPVMQEALRRKLAGEPAPTVYELEILGKDGQRIPLEVSSRLIVHDGRPVGIQGVARDIRERRRSEQALRESQERFRQLADNLPHGFIYQIIQAPDGRVRFSYVSGGVEALCGVTPAEAARGPGTLYGLILPEDLPLMRAREDEAFRQRKPFDCQLRVRAHDGKLRWLHCRSAPRPVPDGGSVWDGIAVDITARKQAEESLRESEERLRLALDAGRVGAWDWDIRTNQVTWSERIYEFHGLPPGTFGGRVEDFAALVHPEDRERVSQAIKQAVENRQPYGAEFRIVRPDGEVRWIATDGRVLFDEAGRPVRMLGATIDVTERRLAEEALKEADRRKDEFLAMLAHELRNPLAPIRNSVQVLKLIGSSDPNVALARDMIERQVAHMARLVDDLLDVSRITRGKILLRKERLDLAALVRAAAEDHRSLLEAAGLALEVDVPAEPVWVVGDRTRLAQVVGNLLHNANKFTDAGGRVHVVLTAGPGADRVAVRVRDTGIGMGPDILGRLFEPFSQADRSIDRSRGGLGLGLALVKGLIELHGGRVEARSPGVAKGSEFLVHLPRAPAAAQANEKAVPRGAAGKMLRVLVIEDNTDSAESLRLLLELSGHRAEVAHVGAAGVEAARWFRPDVILCDIGLPGGMDGYGVARTLRADAEQAEATLIALSGYGQEEDVRKARQAGFDRHLTKPVDPVALTRLLEALPVRPTC